MINGDFHRFTNSYYKKKLKMPFKKKHYDDLFFMHLLCTQECFWCDYITNDDYMDTVIVELKVFCTGKFFNKYDCIYKITPGERNYWIDTLTNTAHLYAFIFCYFYEATHFIWHVSRFLI